MRCGFVPPYLLEQIARAPDLGQAVDPGAVLACRETLMIDAMFRDLRQRERLRIDAIETGGWIVHTALNGASLPGTPVRSQDDDESGDEAVDEAWSGIAATLEMFAEVYDRTSYDDAAARVMATVHYQRDYDNAFWDGTRLVFGDGDGVIFDRFTKPVDVLAHEFSHAVTEHTAGLVYQGQSGALNESVSDVFASCLKQRLLGQDASEGDWLIGAGLLLPGVRGVALRSMAAPGTAYDDPVLGKDPQAGHLDGYVETQDDNGGVHLNSGIPNRAFQLAAVAIGGSSAEGAGRIWYDALLSVAADADFVAFAAATVAAAGEHADVVREAWSQVGVDSTARADLHSAAAVPDSGVVEVSRSGGFAGLVTARSLDLTAEGDRAQEARSLVERIDFAQTASGSSHPDGYVYRFRVGDTEVTVPEHHVSGDLARLAAIVLDEGD
ncbi:Peptidase M4, thermolysin [metagenome]|uniref:Peptidase M4, thermolysin n=1 Tax=metagenome TaxID=256318 RepID=A0A2P2C0D3_9ZZZZ